MSSFERLEEIKTEKYYRKLQKKDVDGRIANNNRYLINQEDQLGFDSIDGEINLKFRERRFVAEIIITAKELTSDSLSVVSKLAGEPQYKKYEVNESKAGIFCDIFSSCDEIQIRLKDETLIESITIYYYEESDFSGILSDISDIREVISEINNKKEKHNELIKDNDILLRQIEELETHVAEVRGEVKTFEIERERAEERFNKLLDQTQTKNEIIQKQNAELSRLDKSVKGKNLELKSLNREIGNYNDTVKGYRSHSRNINYFYYFAIIVCLILLWCSVDVIIEQALSFSGKEFDDLDDALNFLVAKFPVTAAMVTVSFVLLSLAKYCINIINNINNQSLELTKFSVLAKHVVDQTNDEASKDFSVEEINKQKAMVIGELMAEKWKSEFSLQTSKKAQKDDSSPET
ncbi:UNVERIFIED_ORG: hypothetical protein DFO82_0103 [Idiomarina abyssalis]|jgi:hypothetical protein|uniref:Uncharacterized protein n=1 Tax=Idiomarina loihiensis (strain ATCC BAA-735 / DSM 15497 / L2-TR) TaxID=283942 RepID=Q5R0V4_IDILO|nr:MULTISPECIES: hypothetical protein [Idiomarina]AAV82458.1 Hypothetical protein IL1623 [Idiomarina loihiensis L2TR]AGM36496.1 hypothetical protein K734_08165 [Idiomarina loihiensis GSL 199]TDO53896.1 hypothetical protein DEU30_101938 [Idiomarina sp. 017G]